MTWSPYRLPRIRRDLAAAYDKAAADLPAMTRLAQSAGLGDYTPEDARRTRWEAVQLRAAELYWVTPEMTRTALAASGDIPEWTPAAARPGTHGLLVWDGGLPELAWRGAPDIAWTTTAFGVRTPPTVAVDGVSWSPHPAGVRINLMTRTLGLVDDWLMDRWKAVDLFAFAAIELPLLDPVPTTSSDWSSGLIAALGATWLMMMQPTVAETRPLHTDSPDGGASRPPRPDRTVSIIDLRRAHAQPGRDDEPGDGPGRVYRHRWVVRGHWREQAVGTGRSQRRPTWVPAHVKGPAGAPMLETEHIHVWRR